LCALWGKEVSVPMLASYFFQSIGGAISNVTTAQFLPNTIETRNHTQKIELYIEPYYVNFTNTNNTTWNSRSSVYSEMYIPFTISAAISFIVAVLHLILFYKSIHKTISIKYLDYNLRTPAFKQQCIQQIAITVIIGSIMVTLGSIICNLLYLQPYFLVKEKIRYFLVKEAHLSRSNAVYSMSLFTTCVAVGRIIGFVIVRHTGNFRLLVGHIVIFLISMIGLWNCVTYSTPVSLTVITTMLAGLGCSVMSPSISALIEERLIPITGYISGYMFMCDMIGEILTSASMGYLENFSHFVFLYVIIFEVLMLLVFLLMTNCFKS